MPIATTPAGSNRVCASALARTGLPAPITNAIEHVLFLKQLDDLYEHAIAGTDATPPFQRMLVLLNVHVAITPADLERIPKTGPVVFVANHPFGFVEGAVFASVLPRIRPDVKIMANTILSEFRALTDGFLFVNPFGGPDAVKENRRSLRQAVQHLCKGGMLAIFPAGEVAHLDLRHGSVVDPAWNAGVAGMARISGATVVPAFFAGNNSAWFQVLGLVHARVRTALLTREFFNKQSQTIELRIGSGIPAARLSRFATDEEAIAWIRSRAYLLRHRAPNKPGFRFGRPLRQALEPVKGAVPTAQLGADIKALGVDRRIASIGELAVYFAFSDEIPAVLREIGRLREITFRLAGEGTGKPLDIDAFDAHYIHLFIWNEESREIAGAYRLAESDQIRKVFGLKGLYTSTLFRYDDRFLDKVGTGLELGRSFVRPEYQKSYTPLLLLWKAIGAYLCHNPRYTMLFGPVSIISDYAPVSRQLMVSYFTEHERESGFTGMVQARNPLWKNPLAPYGNCRVWDLEDLSAAVADIETDGKGIPVLLRQYLKLGGKLVGFNVDRQFSNTLDGLIVVDLRKTDRRTLERYMGKTEAAGYLEAQMARHAPPSVPSRA